MMSWKLFGLASGFVAEIHSARYVQRVKSTKGEESEQSVPVDLRSSMRLCAARGKRSAGMSSVSGVIEMKLSDTGVRNVDSINGTGTLTL